MSTNAYSKYCKLQRRKIRGNRQQATGNRQQATGNRQDRKARSQGKMIDFLIRQALRTEKGEVKQAKSERISYRLTCLSKAIRFKSKADKGQHTTTMSYPIIVETVYSDSEDDEEYKTPVKSKPRTTTGTSKNKCSAPRANKEQPPKPKVGNETPPSKASTTSQKEDQDSRVKKKKKTTGASMTPPSSTGKSKISITKKTKVPSVQVEAAPLGDSDEESLADEDAFTMFKVGKTSSKYAENSDSNSKLNLNDSTSSIGKRAARKHAPTRKPDSSPIKKAPSKKSFNKAEKTAPIKKVPSKGTLDKTEKKAPIKKVPSKGSLSKESSAPDKTNSPSARSGSKTKRRPRNTSSNAIAHTDNEKKTGEPSTSNNELAASVHLSVKEIEDKLAKLELKLEDAKQKGNYELAADLEHGGIPDLKALLKQQSWDHKVLETDKSSKLMENESTKGFNDSTTNYKLDDPEEIKAKLEKLEVKLVEAERTGNFELVSDLKFGAIPDLKALLKKQGSSGNLETEGSSNPGSSRRLRISRKDKRSAAASPKRPPTDNNNAQSKAEIEKRLKILKSKLAKAEKEGEMDRANDLKIVAIPDLEEKLKEFSSSSSPASEVESERNTARRSRGDQNLSSPASFDDVKANDVAKENSTAPRRRGLGRSRTGDLASLRRAGETNGEAVDSGKSRAKSAIEDTTTFTSEKRRDLGRQKSGDLSVRNDIRRNKSGDHPVRTASPRTRKAASRGVSRSRTGELAAMRGMRRPDGVMEIN